MLWNPRPDYSFDPWLQRGLLHCSGWLGLGVMAAGFIVLGGWTFDIAALKSLAPGLVTMKANTAAAFVMAGASLWLLRFRPRGTAEIAPSAALLARLLAGCVAGIGLLTLAEYGFDWDLGIDQRLFDDPALSPTPGRMALMTALNFTFFGAALLLLDVQTVGGRRPGHWLAMAIAGNSFLAILGYLYGVDALYRVAAWTSVALHTAVLFLVVSLGLVCARPDSRFMLQLVGDNEVSLVNRRLLPAAILIPPFLGWLRWQGELAGLYSTAFGLALFAASNVLVFTSLVWWSARALQRIHDQRNAVSQTSAWQKAILNSADFTMISTDTRGVIRTINAGAKALLGYTSEELVGRETPAILHDPAEVAARAQALSQELGYAVEPGFETFVVKARRGGSDENDWSYIRKDGTRVPVRLSVTALTDRNGELSGFLGIGKDVSALKLAEDALHASEARLRLITDNVPALICYIDRERRFRFNNAVYAQWLERPLAEITGRRLDEVYEAPMYRLIQPHTEAALAGEPVTFEFTSPSSGRYFRGSYIPDVDAANQVIGVYGLINDITEQKEVEARLRQLTQVDSLTGLANRNHFNEKLVEAIARSERTGQPMALIFLDLDHFKAINDQFGHEGGDLALQEFARRLSHSVRASDTVARLAGDEFVIIVEPLKEGADAAILAAKIVAAMAAPFKIFDARHALSTSLGIAVRRIGELNGETLLRRADTALYQVKASGRGSFLVDS